jgi:hypothetical protein
VKEWPGTSSSPDVSLLNEAPDVSLVKEWPGTSSSSDVSLLNEAPDVSLVNEAPGVSLLTSRCSKFQQRCHLGRSNHPFLKIAAP